MGGRVILYPLSGRYFQIDRETAELLSLWGTCRTVSALQAAMESRFGSFVSAQQIEGLEDFLRVNFLTLPTTEAEWRRLTGGNKQKYSGWLWWLLHNYLFVRIPLVQPDAWLKRNGPKFEPFYTHAAAALVVLAGLCGLYLESRQWDVFLATFSHFFSVEGLLIMGIALAIVMSLHEVGHAVTAARYGCRVPAMGVCFILLFPMLYTDVTDAWRLKSRRQRAAIDAAGLTVEVAIACLATFVWAFLPEGPARSLAFALATTGWVMSVGLNLNPFMRFDAYYLLCDATGIDNLQPRAFAFGQWQLREALFGLGAAPPEPLPLRRVRWLVAYAWATWIYRLIVFTGIALIVYHMTFKVLGIALFLIEIWYFIALPIWREVAAWRRLGRSVLVRPRTILTGMLSIGVATVLLVPWSGRIVIPAVVEDGAVQTVFAKRPARVATVGVKRGDRVRKGQLIVRLVSPELDQDAQIATQRIKLITWRLQRNAGDAVDRSETLVLQDQLKGYRARLAGLQEEQSELLIRAEHDGVVAEFDPDLHAGRWLQRTDQIALVRGNRQAKLSGYISETDVERLDTRQTGRFVPDAALGAVREVKIASVAPTGTAALSIVDLASHYGGGIAARVQKESNGGHRHVPVTGQFLIRGEVVAHDGGRRRERGVLHATGRAESIAARAMRQVLMVLIREAGP